jgi:predicted AlkP superfamily pyrophosphatase or phosphodiesterase
MAASHPSGAQRTVVAIVAGLAAGHIGADTPTLRELARSLGGLHMLRPPFPAVTCTSQAEMLTGRSAREHGIVANGWFDRESGEARLWRQSRDLIQRPLVWETARERLPGLTVANLFGWFNMFSSADFTVTPRPQYAADGRKAPDILATPHGLRERLVAELGPFPLFHFWGPRADIRSTEWILQATCRVMQWHDPALTLCYLPHLDYVLQRQGPSGPGVRRELREIDRVVQALSAACHAQGARLIVCSEYGIEAARSVVHPNRALHQAGLLSVREEFGGLNLDPNGSAAFAICDHQVAHVHVRPGESIERIQEILRDLPGVERALSGAERAEIELDHPRSGEIVLLAAKGAWFAYPWWQRDADAPDYARTVDIHRKPGYDPCELLLDAGPLATTAKVAWFMLRRKLGFRALLKCTPMDASLVRGTHGRADLPPEQEPVLLAEGAFLPEEGRLSMRALHEVILRHLLGEPA